MAGLALMRPFTLLEDTEPFKAFYLFLNQNISTKSFERESLIVLMCLKAVYVPFMKTLYQHTLNGVEDAETRQAIENKIIHLMAYENGVLTELNKRLLNGAIGPFFKIRQPLFESQALFHGIPAGNLTVPERLPKNLPISVNNRKTHGQQSFKTLKKYWNTTIGWISGKIPKVWSLSGFLKGIFQKALYIAIVASFLWMALSGFSVIPTLAFSLFGGFYLVREGFPALKNKFLAKVMQKPVVEEESVLGNEHREACLNDFKAIQQSLIEHFFQVVDPLTGFEAEFYQKLIEALHRSGMDSEEINKIKEDFSTKLQNALRAALEALNPVVNRKEIEEVRKFITNQVPQHVAGFNELVSIENKMVGLIQRIALEPKKHSLDVMMAQFSAIMTEKESQIIREIFSAILPQTRNAESLKNLRKNLSLLLSRENQEQALKNVSCILYDTFLGDFESIDYFQATERQKIEQQYREKQNKILEVEQATHSLRIQGSLNAFCAYAQTEGQKSFPAMIEEMDTLLTISALYSVVFDNQSKTDYEAIRKSLKSSLIQAIENEESRPENLTLGFFVLADREYWGDDYFRLRKKVVEKRLNHVIKNIHENEVVVELMQTEKELLLGTEVQKWIKGENFIAHFTQKWLTEKSPSLKQVFQWSAFLESVVLLEDSALNHLRAYVHESTISVEGLNDIENNLLKKRAGFFKNEMGGPLLLPTKREGILNAFSNLFNKTSYDDAFQKIFSQKPEYPLIQKLII